MILLIGKPNTGKSTAINTLIHLLGKDNCAGFYTKEILQNKERVGFRTYTLSDRDFIFAHIDLPKTYAVENFGVDIDSFEKIALNELKKDKKYLIIDEIASMQLYSKAFEDLITELSNSNKKVIASICEIDNDFTASLKERFKDDLYIINEENRDEMPYLLAERVNQDDEEYLSKLELSKKYAKEAERFAFEKDKVILRSTHDVRTITKDNKGYHCTCDYYQRNGTCSHIMSLLRMKKEI
ncbi:MAG: 50S ribosome-binding GTPase [Erysipelotrichaceae bacterium]|nr:50S ribosome-binding GTPase [Erysipelotrichaceae bacterium]